MRQRSERPAMSMVVLQSAVHVALRLTDGDHVFGRIVRNLAPGDSSIDIEPVGCPGLRLTIDVRRIASATPNIDQRFAERARIAAWQRERYRPTASTRE